MNTATPAEYGAAWLDEYDPDWANRINLPTLDLSKPTCCILGQLYSENSRNGYTRLFTRHGEAWTYRLGFDVPDDCPADLVAEAFACLTAEWSGLVSDRQQKSAHKTVEATAS